MCLRDREKEKERETERERKKELTKLLKKDTCRNREVETEKSQR